MNEVLLLVILIIDLAHNHFSITPNKNYFIAKRRIE